MCRVRSRRQNTGERWVATTSFDIYANVETETYQLSKQYYNLKYTRMFPTSETFLFLLIKKKMINKQIICDLYNLLLSIEKWVSCRLQKFWHLTRVLLLQTWELGPWYNNKLNWVVMLRINITRFVLRAVSFFSANLIDHGCGNAYYISIK